MSGELPSPEQLFLSGLRRGYNTRWLYNTCRCGHARVEHAKREGCCAAPSCLCQSFDFNEPPPKPGFGFNTAIRTSAPPEPQPPEDNPAAPTPAELPERVRPLTQAELATSQQGGCAQRCPYCQEAKFNMIPSLQCLHCKAWQHAACVRQAVRCAACNHHWRTT
jgi:hypothetical protein